MGTNLIDKLTGDHEVTSGQAYYSFCSGIHDQLMVRVCPYCVYGESILRDQGWDALVTRDGRLSKRLAKWYKLNNIAIDASKLSVVGQYLRDCMYTVHMSVSYNTDWDYDAGEFSDERSCFWNPEYHKRTRKLLHEYEAYKLMTSTPSSYRPGRIIVLPDTMHNRPDMLFACNAYGDVNLDHLRRVVESLGLYVILLDDPAIDVDMGSFYVNHGKGLLISGSPITDRTITILGDYNVAEVCYHGSEDRHGGCLGDGDHYIRGKYYCDHHKSITDTCYNCGEVHLIDDLTTFNGEYYCSACFDAMFCFNCGMVKQYLAGYTSYTMQAIGVLGEVFYTNTLDCRCKAHEHDYMPSDDWYLVVDQNYDRLSVILRRDLIRLHTDVQFNWHEMYDQYVAVKPNMGERYILCQIGQAVWRDDRYAASEYARILVENVKSRLARRIK